MTLEYAKSPYHKLLLEDDGYRRWIANVERGSMNTASVYFRRIGFICEQFGTTPAGLGKMSSEEATNFIFDVIESCEKRGRAEEMTASYVKAVKSWFAFNGITFTTRFKINRTESRYESEVAPAPEEMDKIIAYADSRAKVACTLVAHSGLRPETLGTYDASDGLELRDLPELAVKADGLAVEFSKIPTLVQVRKSISKTRRPYLTFLSEEGCGYLKNYLEGRLKGGERFTPSTPVFAAMKHGSARHVITKNVLRPVKIAIRRAGFEWRPYVLRRFFDVRMMVAESDHLVINPWRVFWMGHRGDIEATYTVNKRLSQDVIDKMREAYGRAAERHLTASGSRAPGEEAVVATFNRQYLTMAGYGDEEVKQLGDLSQLTPPQIQEMIKQKSMKALGLNGNSQKVVPIDEVKAWIGRGWEYVSHLPGNEAVIRLPTAPS